MNWKILGRCAEGEAFQIAGTNVWDHEWKSLGSTPVEVFDPTAREFHRLTAYEIATQGRALRFAAGETSANVYIFCVPSTGGAA